MAISQVTRHTKFSEWKNITNAIIDAVGDNGALNTTAKSTLVAAINEVSSGVGDLGSIDPSLSSITSVVGGLNALALKTGKLASLSTNTKSNLVNAINEVKSSVGVVSQNVGVLSTLNTTEKSNLVAAVNEAVASIGALDDLSTTSKSTIVSAVNELATTTNKMGDLTTLSTTQKSTLVGAINELATLQLSRTDIPVENILTNRGRFATQSTKTVTTFNPSVQQLEVFNATTVAEGDKFIDGNATYGGAGGTLGADAESLAIALGNAGRTNLKNGFEFFIADYTVGGGTTKQVLHDESNYYAFVSGGEDYLGAIGTTLTFQAWVRVKSVDGAHSGIILGEDDVKTFVNGLEKPVTSKLDVADGWVHVRQTVTLNAESKKYFPAIFANVGDVVQIALPVIVNANVAGVHLGVL